jgi:gliding motility-associated protein GldC
MKNSEIRIFVELNEDNYPESLKWEATDAGFNGLKESTSMLLSFWDKDEKVTLGLDLWTKDMLIDDMYVHYYQVLEKMADTLQNSTANQQAADMIRTFASGFADSLNLKPLDNGKS